MKNAATRSRAVPAESIVRFLRELDGHSSLFTRVEYILCRGAAMLRLSWQNLSVEGATHERTNHPRSRETKIRRSRQARCQRRHGELWRWRRAQLRDPITNDLYNDAEKAALPEKAVAASLGCGNPTASRSFSPAKSYSISALAAASTLSSPQKRVGPTGKATVWT